MSKDVMSKIRASDVWRELSRVLSDYRVEDYRVLDQRPHPVLEINYCGVTRGFNFSGTPSSRFTCKNEAAMLRRLLKDMQMAAISPPVQPQEDAPYRTIRRITFRGQSIDTVIVDSELCVALNPIVEGMGLSWAGQLERIKRDTVLAEAIRVTRMPSVGGSQDASALPLKMLTGFLFGIDESRVKDELREGVLAYKRECYDALAKYWLSGTAPRVAAAIEAPQPANGDILASINALASAIGSRLAAIEMKLASAPAQIADPIALPETVPARILASMIGYSAPYPRGLVAAISASVSRFCDEQGAWRGRDAGTAIYDRAAALKWIAWGYGADIKQRYPQAKPVIALRMFAEARA